MFSQQSLEFKNITDLDRNSVLANMKHRLGRDSG